MAVNETAGKQLWGAETSKAIDNFPVSGERVPTRSSAGWGGSRPRPLA